jgi:dTDP-glucose 4,6-dehydratase
MRRLLVTGGAGFLGVNFTHYWLARHGDDRVVVFDALSYAGNRASLAAVDSNPNFRFVHGDIRDLDAVNAVMRDERIDLVVHFAAETHVDRSIVDPDAFVTTNVIGAHNLLRVARSLWLDGADGEKPDTPRFHHVSTDEVYGALGPDDPGFTEATAYAPNSPYAASKAAADHMVRAYYKSYGLPVTTSNCANCFGPFQYPEKLIPLTIIHLLEGRPVPLYGDGGQVRDWLHADDHCRGIEYVIERGAAGETYNLGGVNERPNQEIVETLCALVDDAFAADPALAQRFPASPAAKGDPSAGLIIFVADRPGHDRRYAIDPAKARAELGFDVVADFKSGLRATVAWYLDNELWWQAIMDDAG